MAKKPLLESAQALADYKPPYAAKIEAMSESELVEFLGLNGSPKICANDGCFREPAPGCVVCLNCLHGTSERACEEYVAAKRRLTRILRGRGQEFPLSK